MPRSVALLSLGCGRNDADSEELAGRLAAAGWTVTDDPAAGEAVLVNTCGFITAAKQDSIDTLLAAAEGGRPVIAVGCLAERYGAELAAELPEATVLSFDDYPQIAKRVAAVVDGEPLPAPHTPRDRRSLLPITPVSRPAAAVDVGIPGHSSALRAEPSSALRAEPSSALRAEPSSALRAEPSSALRAEPDGGPRVLRQRLDNSPVAPLKLASGCDRRCSFCAIPAFRGRFVSRPPEEVLAEAQWLGARGVRELLLVSENSTSYGKDLGDLRALEKLLPQLAATPGIVRVRLSYLQPAELRPSLIETMVATPGVAAYFDLSFQHASADVLRAMRRFGDGAAFLGLLDMIRAAAPSAGARSNFIVGFPGERTADVDELDRFLSAARLDAVGIFGYSDEDGTAAATLPGKIRPGTVDRRVSRISALADELIAQRAEERIGESVDVLVESADALGVEGRAEHQAPEVDGSVRIDGMTAEIGDVVSAVVVAAEGADLVAVVK